MITVKQMKELEERSEKLGVSRLMLMEHAGKCIFEKVSERVNLENKTIIVFAGPGNNGGDGFVAARWFSKKCFVFVLFFGSTEKLTPEAAANFARIGDNSQIEIIRFEDINDFNISHIKKLGAKKLILIDALLGTGVSGAVKEPLSEGIELFNELKGYKVIIDVPSGVDPDTGGKTNHYVRDYDLLISFHDRKKGIADYPKQIIADIGIPKPEK